MEKINNTNLTISHSFQEVSHNWLLTLRPRVKESSYVKYFNIVYIYLNPAFENKMMEEISRADVFQFCSYLSDSAGARSKSLAPKTINDILSVLQNIFKYAAEEKGLPVANISGISVKVPYVPIQVLTISAQKKLEDYLQHNQTPCNIGILLCLYTGLRIGEICALTWEDISTAAPILYVHKTMQRIQQVDGEHPKTKVVVSSPKNNYSIRKIPLPPVIYQLLQENKKDKDAYLLTGQKDRYMEPRSLENQFHKALTSAGIARMNYHVLRHTFATRCVELEFDIKSLSEILGHSTINMTLNKYVHPSMELKQKNMNMLSELFIDS